MKKMITALFACMILLSLSSCADENVNYIESMNDALKISAYLLDENLDENGYWTVNENFSNQGFWVESEGRTLDSREDKIFSLERLKLNEVRMMAPFNYENYNLNIFVDYDGIIVVGAEDEYIRVNGNLEDLSKTHENIKKVTIEGRVSFCPLDEYPSNYDIRNDIRKTKREYYLTVNAYKSVDAESAGSPSIRARLKLTVLEDKGLRSKYDSRGDYTGFEMSRFMSIEMVSYEYSDIYKILDDMPAEEDE